MDREWCDLFISGVADKQPSARTKRILESRTVTEKIGRVCHVSSERDIVLTRKRLINEKKHAIKTAHSDGLEKADDIGKDLLSILSASPSPPCRLEYSSSSVRANMATDLKPDQRMSDDEVMAQITTFVS